MEHEEHALVEHEICSSADVTVLGTEFPERYFAPCAIEVFSVRMDPVGF